MKTLRSMYRFLVVVAVLLCCGTAYAGQFTIAIVQDVQGAGKKYRPLQQYLMSKGIDFSFVAATNYPAAAEMFASGKVDAMFSGSGIAGVFIMKGLANPLVRPVTSEGISTYSAVIIAPKGSPKFARADYFKDKSVILTPLASAGEIFYRSIPNIKSVNATIKKAASHGAAINALSSGAADVAIVKNRVWDKEKGKYPNLVQVGQDNKENPDNTLIVSLKADGQTVSKVKSALLSLRDDTSPQAQEVRKEMDIRGYIETTKADFKHTLDLLQQAGVQPSFNFEFK